MMTESAGLFRIFDRYDILARITPGLLAPLVPGGCLLVSFPQIFAANIYRSIGSGVVMIVLLYLFASMARSRGRAVQHKLKQQWGGFPTEIILRFRDNTIELPTKLAYHLALQELAPDFTLPDAGAEEQDPDGADGIYRAAIRRLIDLRRGPKYPLILNDNISYGFWRNLLGMRGAAILLATCASAAIVAARIAQITSSSASLLAIARDAPAAQMAAFGLLLLWIAFLLFVVRPPRVWDAGVAYAERLLASLPPPSPSKVKGRTPKSGGQGAS